MASGATALQAAVFDLDGVITFTARVHAAAWKELFDEYLRSRATRLGESFQPFNATADYHRYVDGKPRYNGVSSFLNSRGIRIPFGKPGDSPQEETVCGLGNRKNDLFNAKVQEMGVEVDQEAVRFVRELRERDVHIGLASSSKNARPILERVGLLDMFEAIVDGLDSERMGLRGKPKPDIFLFCLTKLPGNIDSLNAMVVEDAIAGVQAGRLGGFGLVLGIDRNPQSHALQDHGAHRVIRNFSEISADEVLEYFRSRAQVA
jgi:alpha,alpha-trehalase